MVAGVKYELVFDAGLSTCANDGTSHTQEACPVSSTSWYMVVVVDQAWMDPRYTLLSHTMEASPLRLSSALLGMQQRKKSAHSKDLIKERCSGGSPSTVLLSLVLVMLLNCILLMVLGACTTNRWSAWRSA